MKFQILIFDILSVLVLSSCHKPEPLIVPPTPTNCETPAGNRNFIWRLDTIAWFPSTVGGVWAFSDTDAYVMGYIVDGKPPYTLRAGRHWNGSLWENNINATYGFYDDIKIDPRNDVTGDDHFMVCVGWYGISTTIYAGVAEFDNSTKKWKSYQFPTVGELRSVWTDGKGYFIAVGDSGMVYSKEGYTAQWIYQKTPTEFNFYRITGVSKNEIYISAYQNLVTGEAYKQGWKYNQVKWEKLFDTKDTTGTPLHLTVVDYPIEMGVSRCNITDSLELFVIGDQSYLFESKGQQIEFKRTNLSDMGLPLKQNGRTGTRINVFSRNDIWVIGTRYNFYHWNGSNFQKMIVPGLASSDTEFGFQLRFVKTMSGKIFIPSEITSQVYVVIQGVP